MPLGSALSLHGHDQTGLVLLRTARLASNDNVAMANSY